MRSPFGCSDINRRIPFPIQFCGSYSCTQINTVITVLKLSSRKDISPNQGWNAYKNGEGGQKGSLGNVGRSKVSNHHHHHHEQRKHRHDSEGPDKDKIYRNEYDDEDESTVVPSYDQGSTPCKPEPEESSEEKQAETTIFTNDDDEVDTGPIDWREPIFLCAFPLFGIVFILLILNILRSRARL